jgi:hypothetical protein
VTLSRGEKIDYNVKVSIHDKSLKTISPKLYFDQPYIK